uniref:RxLR effector protein n=1 Tax=Phytophthora agathidicida TaxID=1642459 RepID=A0A7G4WI13_9STRA|nr:PaRXLR24 [Phytophthora agathidicida]
MRSVFYVAVAVAVFARSSVVVASTNADESQVLSKTSPDFTVDAMISTDSQKRFLRVTDPEDDDLTADDEDRTKYGSLAQIIAKLDEKEMGHVAKILKNMDSIHEKSLQAKVAEKAMTNEEYNAVKKLLSLN